MMAACAFTRDAGLQGDTFMKEQPSCLASLSCSPLQAWLAIQQPARPQQEGREDGQQQQPAMPLTEAEQAPAVGHAQCCAAGSPLNQPVLTHEHVTEQLPCKPCVDISADRWRPEQVCGSLTCTHDNHATAVQGPGSCCHALQDECTPDHRAGGTVPALKHPTNRSCRSHGSGITSAWLLLLTLLAPNVLAAPAITPSAEARQIRLQAARARQALQASAPGVAGLADKTSSDQARDGTELPQQSLVSAQAGGRRSLADPFSSVASISAPLMSAADTGPQALASCMVGTAEQQRLRPLSWERAMKDELGTLQVASVWWSRKPTQVPMTIVTQLSAGRLNQLSAQCKGWRGPLSAAIYVPLLVTRPGRIEDAETRAFRREMRQAAEAQAGLAGMDAVMPEAMAGGASDEVANWLQARPAYLALSQPNKDLIRIAQQAVASLHAAAERMAWACALNMVLVYEVTADVRAATLLYPVNQLRNLARLQARTELIAQLDVDMLLSADMVKWMAHANNSAVMVEAARNKVVYVMPAFEAHGHNVTHSAALSDRLSMQSKRTLATARLKQVVTHFDEKRFPQGHNTTDFPRWFQSTDPYPIAYTYRYEPWLIVHRTLAPWHDVRFRGYGNNKIQQVSHLNSTGHTFMVHPIGFIIHRAHALTEARKQLITDLRSHSMEQRKPGGVVNKSTLYGHTKTLFEAAKALMDQGTFTPVLDPQTMMCMAALPWYQQV